MASKPGVKFFRSTNLEELEERVMISAMTNGCMTSSCKFTEKKSPVWLFI